MSDSWSAMKGALLRQTGFPLDLLDALIHDTESHTTAGLDAFEKASSTSRTLARALRSTGAASHQHALSRLGRLKELNASDQRAVSDGQQALVAAYHESLIALREALHRFDERHARALNASRGHVKRLFQESPKLRQVLMLSNEANYPYFDAWLTKDRDVGDRAGRRMTDLLTMYLQRATTKNETASHFGPVSVAHIGGGGPGMSWSEGPLRRVAFFSHWAAERLAAALGSDRRFRGSIRPRLLPLAFREGERIDRYAFHTSTAPLDSRPQLARDAREKIEAFTGESAERPGGSHYSDRSIFYEEAFGPQRDLTVGENIGRFVEDELSLVYAMVLLEPRARMRYEADILHGWAVETFGRGTRIPLHRFYQAFFSDERQIHAACAEVDGRVAAIEDELRSVLLDGADLDVHEVVVDRQRLETGSRGKANSASGSSATLSPPAGGAARGTECGSDICRTFPGSDTDVR